VYNICYNTRGLAKTQSRKVDHCDIHPSTYIRKHHRATKEPLTQVFKYLSHIYDVALYQKLCKPGEFVSFTENISFQWNTNGVTTISLFIILNAALPLKN
jgi:hypothetical protein